MTTTSRTDRDLKEVAGDLLANAAGYVGHRAISMGLRHGLLTALADHPGSSPRELAEGTDLDQFYVEVWCRAATATGVLERDGELHRLAPHVDTLLLEEDSPAFIGGIFPILEQPEVFDLFEERLPTGQRTWWNECSEEFLRGVAATGRPFNRRLIPGGLQQVDDVHDRLHEGGRVLDTACGAGAGVELLLRTYPEVTVVGADGDAASLEMAADRLAELGLDDRVEWMHTPLEEMDVDQHFDLVTNNVSMHECRDIEQATANIHRALRPGGWFVISDFPFPDDTAGLRTVPGRVMSGIQFFEAQIDDQLVAPSVYLDLLQRHGFEGVDSFTLTPVHAVTHGRRPR